MHKTLTAEEWKIVRAYRALRAFEDRQRIPSAFRIHGTMPIAEAAQLLGVEPSELATQVPILPDGSAPRSELMREASRRNRDAVRSKAHDVERLVRPKTVAIGIATVFEDRDSGYGVEELAQRLETTKAAARRLMEHGPLFTTRTGRGGLFVTTEELDAYLKANPTLAKTGTGPTRKRCRAKAKQV